MMHSLLELLVSNSLVVLPIAIIATLGARRGARPALVHALWLVVLLKLITPPLVRVPVSVEWGDPTSWSATQADDWGEEERALTLRVVESARPERGGVGPGEIEARESALDSRGREPSSLETPLDRSAESTRAELTQGEARTHEADTLAESPAPREEFTLPPEVWNEMRSLLISIEARPRLERWLEWAMFAWIAGALLVAAISLRNLRRFSRQVAKLPLAPAALQEEVAKLCAQISLPAIPSVRTTRAVVSPMVWAPAFRPQLILPELLLERLSADERQTLILHELAHVRRRDHWVRYLELAVRIVHFANPLAWWAIHELRAAEEECCDVWVTTVFQNSERPYSAALLAAAEFLTTSRQRLPTTSTGFGAVPEMRRRLTMIFHRQTQRSLGLAGRALVVLAALFTLPLLPGWAQDAPGREPVVRQPAVRKAPTLEALFRDGNSVDAAAPRVRNTQDAVEAPVAPAAPAAPRAPAARDPRFPGLASAPVAADAPRPAEVARALDLAVRLLIENGHVEEGQTLIRMAEEMANPPQRVRGANVRASRPERVSRSRADFPRFRTSRTVIVKEGDSLYSLAEEYLGSSRRWTELARANDLEEGEGVRVGQSLRIPEEARAAEAGNLRTRYEVQKEYPTVGRGSVPGGRAVEERVEQLEKQLGELQGTLEQLLEQLKRQPDRSSRRSGR